MFLYFFNWFCVTSEIENAGENWAGTATGGGPGRTWTVKKIEGRRANDSAETWRTTSG